MKNIVLILFCILTVSVTAQNDSTSLKKPQLYPAWACFLPGGTHFYDHRIGEGIIFSGIELGGLTYGLLKDRQLQTTSSTPYYNFPLLIGMQAYNIDKCDYLRNTLEVIKYKHPDFKYDPIAFNDLLKAPFQPKNVFTAITGELVALAVLELLIQNHSAKYHYGDINQMYFINRYIDRDPAMAIYGATSLLTSYGAGISEEYIFRNTFLPFWDYKYGQKKGLIYSSLLFGSMHLGNLAFSKHPDYAGTLLQVAEATLLGYLLGRDVQNRGYKIGPAVAAHAWYDFVLMLGSYIVDPENNVFGVDLKFTF